MSSHPQYWEHHTHSLYGITLGIGIVSFALQKTSHPHFMKRNHHFYDITPTILDLVSLLFLSQHPLYWWYHTDSIYEISSSIYVKIISIVYNNIFTIFVPSQPLYLHLTTTLSMISNPLYIWHCTHYMFNIKYTLWGFTSTVYDITLHYLWDHIHCIHVITPSISNTASTLSVSSQSLYIWSLNNCMYGITPTLYMISYAPWIMSYPLFEFTPF